MTHNNQAGWRKSRIWLAVAFALLAAACGSDSGETVTAAAPASAAVVEPDPTPVAEPGKPTAVETVETSEADEAQPVSEAGVPVRGTTTFEWIPHCSLGPPFNSEPADCEVFGDYTLLRATLSGERTGTFEGVESLHATFAIAPDGRYVFGGISSFVGTVAECGDGTVIYNTAGWGTFDLEQATEIGAPVLGGAAAISYSPTASKLNTIDMVIDTEMTATAPNTFEVTGTVACDVDTDAASLGVTLPDSGVSEDEALEWSGSGTFAFGSNCSLSQSASATPPCEIVNGFVIQPLLNSLTFSGPFAGDARFIGANLLATDSAEYEHSGILIFEGDVEGCGNGIVIMVNEAAGNGQKAGFPYLRAFTPPQFELGSLGVHVDATASIRGFASTSMDGIYSCTSAAETAVGDAIAGAEQNFDALDEYVTETVLANPALDGAGIIVVDADGVLHHQSYGDFALDRVSAIASSSKMISAGVLLRLQEEGVLDIDAPLTDLTDLAVDHPELTVAQLLSNSSGLVADGVYPPYFCQIVGPDLSECTATILTTPDDDADVIAPDTQFQYGGAQWQVAGGIAEIASGESWADLIDRIYVEPCGLDSLVYAGGAQAFADFPAPPAWFEGDPATVPDTANPNIEGGAFINIADYGTLLQMHLTGGQCPGGPVLSQASLDIMHADRIGAVYDGTTPELGGGYGMGWWHYGLGEIGDPGAFGARAWINADAGYAAYWVIEDSFVTSLEYEAELRRLVHQAVTGEALGAG